MTSPKFNSTSGAASDAISAAESRSPWFGRLKVGLSLFLIYHFATILLMPIGSSLPARKLARYFLPYANTLGFNTTWSFFSPAPSPSFFLEYDVDLADGTEANGGQPYFYPPARPETAKWEDGWNRRLYGMRFFALAPDRLEQFFVPFLCRITPQAKTISVQAVFEQIEDLEKAGTFNDLKDTDERVDLPRQHFSCPEATS